MEIHYNEFDLEDDRPLDLWAERTAFEVLIAAVDAARRVGMTSDGDGTMRAIRAIAADRLNDYDGLGLP